MPVRLAPSRSGRVALVGGCLAAVLGACSSGPPGSVPRTTGTATTAAAPAPVRGGTPGTATSGPPQGGGAWLTYGGSFSRTSVDTSSSSFTRAPTKAWTSPALDGPVYGEPLLDGGTVYVATEHDTVYALSGTTGAVLWSQHLGTPVPAADLPCGDISPEVGVTSTMVIDPSSGTLFVSAAVLAGHAVEHQVFAFDLATHAQRWRRDVDQPGWTAAAELQRAALALSHGHVLVAFGGNYGDCGPYHGWVVGVPESGTGALESYRVPTAREGAIWAPAGVTVDAGDVFVVTGNGSARPGQPFDHGNAVIELSPSLSPRRYFAPRTWAQDNATDADLASTAAVVVEGNRLFVVGKEKTAYLLDAAALGGIGGQLASLPVCDARGGNAYLAPHVFVACPLDGAIDEVQVGPGDTLHRGWTWRSPTGGASSPTISGGVLWCVDPGASLLYGVDPASGATLYRLRLHTGTPPHFAAPAAAGGLLVVAGSRAVEAFR